MRSRRVAISLVLSPSVVAAAGACTSGTSGVGADASASSSPEGGEAGADASASGDAAFAVDATDADDAAACLVPDCFSSSSLCKIGPWDSCGVVGGRCTCIVTCLDLPDGGERCPSGLSGPCSKTDDGKKICGHG